MIRIATYEDIPQIMKFINDYWKAGHILARDKEFFEYMYRDNDKVNFVVSVSDAGVLEGILGFIPYGKGKNYDIMDALWKVIPTDNPHLGIDLLRYVTKLPDVRIVASPGINEKTIPIYKWMGYYVGKFVQWYRINDKYNKDKFVIAKIENFKNAEIISEQWNWKEIVDFQEFQKELNTDIYCKSKAKPFKELDFINKRYFEHPRFKYRIWGLYNPEKQIETFFVTRKQEYLGASAIRVIDCIGNRNAILYATKMFDEIVVNENAEYIDFFEAGIEDEVLEKAGWMKVEDSGNIIPDYFAPFVQNNNDIYYFSTDEKAILFKGDGDQDRPS